MMTLQISQANGVYDFCDQIKNHESLKTGVVAGLVCIINSSVSSLEKHKAQNGQLREEEAIKIINDNAGQFTKLTINFFGRVDKTIGETLDKAYSKWVTSQHYRNLLTSQVQYAD